MNFKSSNSVINFEIDDAPADNQLDHIEDTYNVDIKDFLFSEAAEVSDEGSQPLITNQSVKKAGRKIRKDEGDLKSATKTIQSYRAAHSKPLSIICYLLNRYCKSLGVSVTAVRRLKRLDTIINKLQRKSLDGKTENKTCVTNMNDIGGCRLIFPNMQSLLDVKDTLLSHTTVGHRIVQKKIYDYINLPKENDCGYRGLHIVYEYKNRFAGVPKLKIEAQLRTRLQHVWATTVEIVDIIEKTNIKTHSHSRTDSKSSQQILWEEFLLIMSCYIANNESGSNYHVDYERLLFLEKELNVCCKLKAFSLVSNDLETQLNNPSDTRTEEYVLVSVNVENPRIDLLQLISNKDEAISAFNLLETISADTHSVLLVSTSNVQELSSAYPNYAGDCDLFIDLLSKAITCK